jgi:hypothetical protein
MLQGTLKCSLPNKFALHVLFGMCRLYIYHTESDAYISCQNTVEKGPAHMIVYMFLKWVSIESFGV